MYLDSLLEQEAFANNDSEFFLDKGAKFYVEGNYAQAIEYYRIAAILGNVHALSNLGYCYMYGRSVDINMGLAIMYFKKAAKEGDIDALYKLGDIYRNGRNGIEQDKDLGVYYLLRARDKIKQNYEPYVFRDYPSLCLALAHEYITGEFVDKDLDEAYGMLYCAQFGYEKEIENGAQYYVRNLKEVKKLMKNPMFNKIADEFMRNANIEIDGEDRIEEITIRLDYHQGPIWLSDFETGTPLTESDIVNEDKKVIALNHKISKKYSSYFEFESHGKACWVNEEQMRKDKEEMLLLLKELKDRLEFINDGSFEINDEESPKWMEL